MNQGKLNTVKQKVARVNIDILGISELKGTGIESETEVAQSCPTLCDPMNWGLPGISVHGIFQARVLEWVAISFSRGHLPDTTLIKGSFGNPSVCTLQNKPDS